ncbi:hypothetical protein FBD94_09770 [Pedobacter hiemivivus]|uniref:Uncharacterized protein n=1 Tax=Pedobacter hiemivivus TaxID=2530454 RepID=A0A4U1GHV8_9SPHI|nr:hypothetical protein [Pedobacter hiemivivus]TKC62493.1 hypothetical protein FBD94_09770 [Pedobacter hiemivivus]
MDQKPKLETLIIELSPSIGALWKANDKDMSSSLEHDLVKNQELISFINRYQKDKWQVYSIDKISMTDHMNNEGGFKIQYTSHEYNGCKDLSGEDEDYLIISFLIDLNRMQIIITGDSI